MRVGSGIPEAMLNQMFGTDGDLCSIIVVAFNKLFSLPLFSYGRGV